MYGTIFALAVTDLVGDETQPSYAAARDAVRDANSLGEAMEGVRVFDTLEAPAQAEARAILEALPRAVDEAIIAAAESAFEDGIPITVEWHPGPTIEARISEVQAGGARRLRIDFISPRS